jgi:hypothetical protein
MNHLPDAAIVLLAIECLADRPRSPTMGQTSGVEGDLAELLSLITPGCGYGCVVGSGHHHRAYCLLSPSDSPARLCSDEMPHAATRARIARLGHFNALRGREHSRTLPGFHNTTNLAPLASSIVSYVSKHC